MSIHALANSSPAIAQNAARSRIVSGLMPKRRFILDSCRMEERAFGGFSSSREDRRATLAIWRPRRACRHASSVVQSLPHRRHGDSGDPRGGRQKLRRSHFKRRLRDSAYFHPRLFHEHATGTRANLPVVVAGAVIAASVEPQFVILSLCLLAAV